MGTHSSVKKRSTMKAVFALLSLAVLAGVQGSPVGSKLPGPIDKFACDFCKWMVGEIETLLEQGKTEDDVIVTLKGLCDQADDLVPGIDLGTTCKAFVDTYAKPAIDELIKDTQPDFVCNAIGACHEETTPAPPMTTTA